MAALEQWVLRIADSDATWCGLGWLRPARHRHLGPAYILISSLLLGLPGIALGGGLVFLTLGHVEPALWLTMFGLVMLIELPLHILFAHYWNRRANALREVGQD